jgi:hypothetical protein
MLRMRSILAFAGAVLALGAFRSGSNRAWPWFMLVRGDRLSTPVIIGRRFSDMNGDIIKLYSSFSPASTADTISPSRQMYEVAEFWGGDWMPFPDGKPPTALRFERGGTFAKIYAATSKHPPVWVGRSQGVDRVPMFIGDSGQAVLTRAGLKLR